MYLVAWALKNVFRNPLRSARNAGFVALVSFIVMAWLAFLDGTNVQMKRGLSATYGDITVSERVPGKGIGLPAETALLDGVGPGGRVARFVAGQAEALGSGSWASVKILGAEDGQSSALAATVDWPGGGPGRLAGGGAWLPVSLAARLGVGVGDWLTLKTASDAELINTVGVEVNGLLSGSELAYGDTVIIDITDARSLYMLEQDHVSFACAFLAPGDANAEALYSRLSVGFFKSVIVESLLLYPEDVSVYDMFQKYRILLVAAFSLCLILACVVLVLSTRNTFFLYYHARRSELATLMTFGMAERSVAFMACVEATALFVLSMAAVVPLCALAHVAAGAVTFSGLGWSDLVTVFGGPRLVLSWSPATLGAATVALLVVVVLSALRGARTFLSMEIRQVAQA
ncbi:MAG: hypothetical protein KBB32_03775 [Spirochaetia bacterium]|nr:hypothetical protein [Spirochaetia bacterium]